MRARWTIQRYRKQDDRLRSTRDASLRSQPTRTARTSQEHRRLHADLGFLDAHVPLWGKHPRTSRKAWAPSILSRLSSWFRSTPCHPLEKVSAHPQWNESESMKQRGWHCFSRRIAAPELNRIAQRTQELKGWLLYRARNNGNETRPLWLADACQQNDRNNKDMAKSRG